MIFQKTTLNLPRFINQKITFNMKKLLMAAFFTAVTMGAFAQSEKSQPLHFSVGLEAALPFGDYGDVYSFGIGGSVQGNYWLDETLALTLNAGYMNYSGKTVNGYKYASTGMVPVLAGIEYNFTPNVFASGQLGLTFGTEKGAGSNFTYAPGVGYRFSPNFSALLKYTGMSVKGGGSSFSAAGLRVAYTF